MLIVGGLSGSIKLPFLYVGAAESRCEFPTIIILILMTSKGEFPSPWPHSTSAPTFQIEKNLPKEPCSCDWLTVAFICVRIGWLLAVGREIQQSTKEFRLADVMMCVVVSLLVVVLLSPNDAPPPPAFLP